MRAARWVAGIVAGLVLILLAAVVIVTLVIDPNRFKGRIESMVSQATGSPFSIQGDLDIAWYPWLALKMGEASLGESPPLLQWRSASFGARLVPLIRGRLEVSRIRLDGLRVHLERGADGRGNWETLLAAQSDSKSGSTSPELGGLDIRDGALEYVDAKSGSRIALSGWQLDVGAWKAGRPFSLSTRFALANASVDGKAMVESLAPLRAQGALSLQTDSLRKLLTALAVAGPRPRDTQTLAKLDLRAEWSAIGGAFTLKPLDLQLDDTKLKGEAVRPAGEGSVLRFELRGDHIALDRYVQIEDAGSEPFELPVAALQGMPVAGVLSFAEAQMAGAKIRNARIRLETNEGAVASVDRPGSSP